jgi:FMN phosphatase YigB (HAD superfamily)
MNKESCKKIFFFDLDDTLVRTTEFNEAAVRHSLKVLEKFNINISQNDAWNFYESVYQDIKASSEMMSLYYNKLFEKNPEILNEKVLPWRVESVGVCMYEEFFEEHIKEFIPRGVIASLEKICKKGCEVGILSQGKPDFQIRKFNCLGFEKFFNPELKYYFEKKTEENYNLVKEDMKQMFPDHELFMVGDREDIDILRPQRLGFTPIRILVSGKYNHIKTSNEYIEYKNFEDFSEAIKSGQLII